MNFEREIKKLTIHSTLWTKPIEIVELDDVILNKLSVKSKYILKYDLIDYTIKYDGGGFWLYIDDLEGYFNFNNGIRFLEIMFKDAEDMIEYGIKLLIMPIIMAG